MTHTNRDLTNPGPGDPSEGSFSLKLKNLSGVPVLEILGDLNQTSVAAVDQLLTQLVRAGHYHLVINIEKAKAVNATVLRSLDSIAGEAKKHYGAITLVTGLEQAGFRLTNELCGLFRTCKSEASALIRIKGLRNVSDEQVRATPARLR